MSKIAQKYTAILLKHRQLQEAKPPEPPDRELAPGLY